jgi:hypothetical protein
VLTAIVTPNQVKFKGQIKTEDGQSATLNDNIARNGNHFSGTINAFGGQITINGRIDPEWVDDDGTQYSARLVGLCRGGANNATYGRMAGHKNSNAVEDDGNGNGN